MERISLPTRTVSARGVVVIPAALAVILVMAGWVATAAYYEAAWRIRMKDFRTVVITGRPIEVRSGGELNYVLTLFEEGGRSRALRHQAEEARRMDRWNAEMCYLFARALWREYLGPASAAGVTPGLLKRDDIPRHTLFFLRMAAQRDPTNCFYRATLATVLSAVDSSDQAKKLIDELLLFYAPQDTYARIRTAEMLTALGTDKRRVLMHYRRALELVSTEIGSGLLTVGSSLGPRLDARAVNGLLKNVGPYATWAADVPDYPESHWVVGIQLRSQRMDSEASTELGKVVDSVARRLTVQRQTSRLRSFYEIICPFAGRDYSDRFLMNREIGQAAAVLEQTDRPDEAIRLYRIQVASLPTDIPARLALGEALLSRAAAFQRQASEYRDTNQPQEAAQAETAAQKMRIEADDQVSAVLNMQPLSPEALNLRARIPKPAAGS